MTAAQALAAMAALPVAGLGTILDGRDVLVLAPHADDESLGCGGLLAASAASGGRPAVLVLTDGAGSHPCSRRFPPERLRAVREAEARAAVEALGVGGDRLGFMRFADTRAPLDGPEFERAVAAVVDALDRWNCGVLLASWRHDPHGDHVAAHGIATAAAARAGVRHLAYPVWGLTLPGDTTLDGRLPSGWRLDVTAQLERKRQAIAAHRSQYAGLIDDDPSGFQLAPSFLERFDGPFETFLQVDDER